MKKGREFKNEDDKRQKKIKKKSLTEDKPKIIK